MPSYVIEDANGIQRVTFGDISAAQDGSSFGIKILSADGTTVIIDGTSDVFKIIASGTTSVAGGSGSANSTTVDLAAFSLATTPALIGLIGYSSAAGSTRHVAVQVAVSSVGPPMVISEFAHMASSIPTAPGAPRVTLSNDNSSAGAQTAFGLYYMLLEVAM